MAQRGDERAPVARTARPGRPRSRATHQAIIDAALAILDEEGYRAVTVERIAARAGVGKQTIYRWWDSKAAVVLEAFTARAAEQVPLPDTGTLEGDLTQFLGTSFRTLTQQTGGIVRSLMAEAQIDPAFAAVFRDAFIMQRRRACRTLLQRGVTRGEVPVATDLDLLLDLAYGAMWYRLLVGHAPLDDTLARQLAQALVSVATTVSNAVVG